MFNVLMQADPGILAFLDWLPGVLLVLLGFSVVIFVHELGHFVMAKWAGVRVEKFAVGFGPELFGRTHGETRYCFNLLPLGGYVKMLGQEDFAVDKSGELMVKADPRSFISQPVGPRMWIVSAGVIMNIAFAAFLFMLVFMIGMDRISPVVGLLTADGPAMRAGMQMGDEILDIDGKQVEDFADIKMAIVLSDPHDLLNIRYRRGDTISTVQVRPEPSSRDNLLQIGFQPAFSHKVGKAFPQGDPTGGLELRKGDTIVGVNGRKMEDFTQVLLAMLAARGKPVALTAERQDPNHPDAPPKTFETQRRLRLSFLPTTQGDLDTQHLLGLVPLRRVTEVDTKERAWLAGFRVNDTILQWGDIQAPTYGQIATSIAKHPNQDVRVKVRRPGKSEPIDLVIRPRSVRKNFFTVTKPAVGMKYDGLDDTTPIISHVVKSVNDRPTPAASLGLEPGDRITKIDDQPVDSWVQIVDVLITKAGSQVQLTYRTTDGREITKPMDIPHSLATIIGLPATGRIISIGGEKRMILHDDDGKPRTYAAGSWVGARELLTKHVGQTVEVVYRDMVNPSHPKDVTKEVDVSEALLDPWLLRIHYDDPGILPMPLVRKVRTSNPFRALFIGCKKTYYFIAQSYLTMKRMLFSQTVGLEHVSGPVGIMKQGVALADAGFVIFLYFLAFISANLAVINFLPLPIVDGGLMIFLLIEKIKGKPVSIKTQVVTQIIGLGLIIATFVFVTILDLQKL